MLIRHKNEQICCKHCNRIWICHQYTCSKRIPKLPRSFHKRRTHREAEHHICHETLAESPFPRKHTLSGFIWYLRNHKFWLQFWPDGKRRPSESKMKPVLYANCQGRKVGNWVEQNFSYKLFYEWYQISLSNISRSNK